MRSWLGPFPRLALMLLLLLLLSLLMLLFLHQLEAARSHKTNSKKSVTYVRTHWKKVLVFLAKNTSLTQMNSSKLEIFNLALIFFCYAHTTSDSYGFNPATYFIAWADNTYHKGKDHYKASLQVTGSALTKQENVICGNWNSRIQNHLKWRQAVQWFLSLMWVFSGIMNGIQVMAAYLIEVGNSKKLIKMSSSSSHRIRNIPSLTNFHHRYVDRDR